MHICIKTLIVKTLRQLNLLQDSAGGECNIIIDNCSGQNKNNTVLKLAAWLQQMGYFKKANFVFLIVGHTKNAADRLFNSLKELYRKQNLFTMQGLFNSLYGSDSVTIIPASSEDFLDFDALFDNLYRNLTGKVKTNHIFAVTDKGGLPVIELRKSNLIEHGVSVHAAAKKSNQFSAVKLREHSSTSLLSVKCLGMNPYKSVELWKNYRPVVPVEFWEDIMYTKHR